MNGRLTICPECKAAERTIIDTPGHYPAVTSPVQDGGTTHLQWGDPGQWLCTGFPDYFQWGLPQNRAARRQRERLYGKAFPGIKLNPDGSPRDPRDDPERGGSRGPGGHGPRNPPTNPAPSQPLPGLFG